MSYLERLKNLKGAAPHPTKPTKPPETVNQTGFVGFVGSHVRDIQNPFPTFQAGELPLGGKESEASNDPEPPTANPANPAKQTYREWVETWQPLADAYHRHHFNCPTCIASGKGYGMRCGVGTSLWIVYAKGG